jgi:hypothetical protein
MTSEVKVKLPLCVMKHHCMKICKGAEVLLHWMGVVQTQNSTPLVILLIT